MTTTDFNINPYFDDYDETKGFYRILYRPSYAVQAREVTQQQTILQKQIERFGDHVFEDGSVVTGAEHFLDLEVTYLKLEEQFAGENLIIENYNNQLLIGSTSGAVGKVVHVEDKTVSGDPPTLFVKEQSGTFIDGEDVVAQDSLSSATLIASAATGKGSLAGINEGVYFVDGFFVFVNKQLIVLEKYSNTPTYRIGLSVVDDIITEEDDQTLLDPAFGASNYLAPGSHRFKIELLLRKKRLDFDNDLDNAAAAKFIEILRVENGIRTKDVKYSIYSDLEDNLARRTHDESGNYTVEPFQINIEEDPSDTSKLQVGLEPGKAYVRGYEHRTIITEFVDVDKGRDTQQVNNYDINAQYGNYCIVTNVHGIFDPTQIQEVKLLSSDIAGTTGGNFTANTIGTANLRAIEYDSESSVPYKYRMYLYNFDFPGSESFKDVNSIWVNIFGDDIKADIDTVDGQDGSGNSLLFGTQFNKLLFRTPNSAVQTLRPGGNTDTDYTTQKAFNVSFIGGSASINVTGANTFFGALGALAPSVIRENYHIVLDTVSNAGGTGLGDGDVVDFTTGSRSVTLSGGTQVATFDIDDPAFAATGTVIATVNLNEKSEKTKVLTNDTAVGIVLSGGVGSLNRSDIWTIVEIRDAGDSFAVVTDKFTLDNGQRDNYYDHGSIVLKDGETIVGPLEVDYQYFSHSGSGYFSVDSYDGVIDYEDIPSYTATDGQVFELRDVLDFRPRREDFGSDFDVATSGVDLPRPNTNINADYIFYLPRIDKVVLRANREFDVIRGVSNLNPVTPADDEDAMSLYTIKVPAYTFDVNNVEIEYIDNRRYTMRDIGIIEQRLNTVEYYTALSLLEKETKDLTIVDGVGIEQFKSGILVDSFAGHGIGDVVNPDYQCSIDFEKRELRPSVTENNVEFTFSSGESVLTVDTGDLVTLGYTDSNMIKQPLSNDVVNVNPFTITGWTGTVKLSPEVDSWFDTDNNPKVVTNATGENDAWRTTDLGFGTQWNNWIANWAGIQTASQNPEQFSTVGNDPISRETAEASNSNSRQQLRSRFSPQSIVRKVGTRTVNESVVPYIRARQVTFEGRGLKPNTQVYPFFDGVDVSAYCAPSGGSNGDPLITDDNGAIDGTFDIPNVPNTIQFRTGERLFRLTDSSTNSLPSTTTVAERRYLARGLIQTREDTIISTRAPIIRRKASGDSILLRDPVSREQISSNNITTEENWFDPLAQLFTVDSTVYTNGVFLSKLRLFFASKDANIPVSIEIRPTINSYPHASLIVPFSQVTLNPSEVSISEDGSIATEVTFDSPIYLQPGQYAIVVTTNSDQYTLYTGEEGQLQTNSNLNITRQPFVGNLFQTQNIQNYNPNLQKMLKFEIDRCEFETSGEAVLNNITPSSDVIMDVIYTLTSQLRTPGTSINFYYKAKDLASGNMDSSWNQMLTDQNFKFNSQKFVDSLNADTLKIRAVMTTNDSAVSPVVDLQRLTTVAVENNVNNDSTNELLPAGGNAEAVYITRRVTLKDGFDADGMRVFLTGYKSALNNFKVYVKVLNGEDGELFDNRPWLELDQLTEASTISLNENDFREFEFGLDGISYSGFTNFQTFAVKIVMLSTNTSDVPRLRDMRAIALRS